MRLLFAYHIRTAVNVFDKIVINVFMFVGSKE